MLKEKYLVFFVLLAVGINVSVLACLILMGIRLDAPASPRTSDRKGVGGLLREYRIPLEVREAIAAFLFAVGRRPLHSTSIAGTETSGYGELDDYGFWEYPLYAA